jgi:hypothetical protein
MQGYHVDDDVLHTRCVHKFDLVLLQARTLGFRVARYLELLSMCTDPLIGPQRNKRAIVHKQQPCLALLLELYKYIDSCLLLLAVLDHCERLAV